MKNLLNIIKQEKQLLDKEFSKKSIGKYIRTLSRILRIQENELLFGIKRYYIRKNEDTKNIIRSKLLIRFLLSILSKATFLHGSTINKNIVFDKWEPVAVDSFYGEELVKFGYVDDILSYRHIFFIDILKIYLAVFFYFRCLLTIDRRILYCVLAVFMHGLTGKNFGSVYNPKVIVSGNDNGFSLIFAKSAKAKIILIQNGLRGITRDSFGICANHYFAMALWPVEDLSTKVEHFHLWGSLRLINYLRYNIKNETRDEIVFVSSLVPDDEQCWDHNPGNSLVYKAIEYIKEYKNQIGVQIVFLPRRNSDRYLLANHRLLDVFDHFYLRSENPYSVVLSSRLVLTTDSTLGVEAIMAGVPAFFITLGLYPFLFSLGVPKRNVIEDERKDLNPIIKNILIDHNINYNEVLPKNNYNNCDDLYQKLVETILYEARN